MANYNVGDKIGPKQILFLEERPKVNNNKRRGYFLCPSCGNPQWETCLYDVVSGKATQCIHCRKQTDIQRCITNGNRSKIDLTNQKIGLLTVLEETPLRKNHHIVWRCRCECGRETLAPSSELQRHRVICCDACKTKGSRGELMISHLLAQNNIIFEREKTFENCFYPDSHKKPRFDFYVEQQYLIEFDGRQHFKETNFFTETLESNRFRDTYKNQWCQKHNIPLIRIPYTHLQDICIDDLILTTSSFRIN